MGRKATTITLSTEDREFLELQTRARTIQAQTVNRARILLLKADGNPIDAIADKVGLNRKNLDNGNLREFAFFFRGKHKGL